MGDEPEERSRRPDRRPERILAVDVGTQSLRASVMDRSYRTLETARVSYFPRVLPGNRVEIDAETLWRAFIQACSELTPAQPMDGVSFSTLCPSLLAMDCDGNPLTPLILHMDRRSYRQAAWAMKKIGEEKFLKISGNLPIPGGISATSLLWIKENHPDIYRRPDVVFGHAVTFFMKRTAGRFLIDPSNASFTGLYDTVGYGSWSPELFSALQIEPEKLPEVVMSETVAGELDYAVARAARLPGGIPVVIGANDTTCAAVGIGVSEPGMLMNTSGTTEILVLCLDSPLVGKDHLLRTHAYPNRWLAMRTVGAGGGSLEWFRKNFCREMSKESFYDEYLTETLSARNLPRIRFHPYLTGDRHRLRQRFGAFSGITLDTSREDCLLALSYGIVSFQMKILDTWRRHTPLKPEIYHVGGGASESYTRFKQALLKDFRFIPSGETALKGAAMLGFGAIDKI
jgi:sugar (pentulose or hexulose) kinase